MPTPPETKHTERCPTCGRYTSLDDGFGDVEPGGLRGTDYLSSYCDAGCALRKYPPARCEEHEEPGCAVCWPDEADYWDSPGPRATGAQP